MTSNKPTLLQSCALGGTAAILTVNFTHPIETIKTRMQVNSGGCVGIVQSLLRTEGVMALWKGIPFAYARELSYTSIKLGAYAPVRDLLGANKGDSVMLKFLAGAITGGTGSILGNPFDVLKTLSQTSTTRTQVQKLISSLYQNQGISGFYRGVQVNILRACVLNATKMGVYDLSKGFIVDTTGWDRRSPKTAFLSSFIAGFFMTITVAPCDMIRTKLMNQPVDVRRYGGFVDCVEKSVRMDGVLSLWRGFVPIWMRFAPMATGQLLSLELLYGLCGFETL